jgi:hypothetical protein
MPHDFDHLLGDLSATTRGVEKEDESVSIRGLGSRHSFNEVSKDAHD